MLNSTLKDHTIGNWEWNIETGEAIIDERWAEIMGYSSEEISPLNVENLSRFTHPNDLKTIVLPKNWTVQMINKFELLNEQKEKKIQFRV